LTGVLHPGEKVTSESLGLLAFELPDVYVHDLLGLTDEWLAHHGNFRNIFGRRDYAYTANQVRPLVYVMHSGFDHLQPLRAKTIGRDFNERYETWAVPDQGIDLMVSMQTEAAGRIRPALARLHARRVQVP
jgi:hypothetical protein